MVMRIGGEVSQDDPRDESHTSGIGMHNKAGDKCSYGASTVNLQNLKNLLYSVTKTMKMGSSLNRPPCAYLPTSPFLLKLLHRPRHKTPVSMPDEGSLVLDDDTHSHGAQNCIQ